MQRFATTEERRTILRGWLAYRAALRTDLGVGEGWQWLDGSFVEDVERLERRAPRDVDVVTFATFPAASRLTAEQRRLVDPRSTKASYHCDSYVVDLQRAGPLQLVARATYWFGLFAHRRDGSWKGMVAVPLDVPADERAWAVPGMS